jgi:hypothetical protein
MNTKNNILPKFKTEEQEAEYWDQHSPLDLIDEPEMEKVQVKRVKDRPIAIRLDSKTRDKLNTLAVKQGMGPSTLARHIIQQVLENKGNQQNNLDLNGLMNSLTDTLVQVNDAKAEYNHLKTGAGGLEKSPLLVFQGGKKDLENFSAQFLERVMSTLGIRVITSDQIENEKAKVQTSR